MAGERVLIVDDYQDGREICAEFLDFYGYDVVTAEDGEEALAKARELLPDVILLDLSLPKLSGWEVARLLRSEERTKDILILAVTAHAVDELRQRALDMGCDGVVIKPVIPKELELQVREALARRRTGRAQES